MRRIGLLWAAWMLTWIAPARADVFEYVAAPDASFQWSEAEAGRPGIVNLSLTSQTWQGSPWHHTLSIVRPAQPKYPDLAVLLITGGSYQDTDMLTSVGTLLANNIGVTFAVLWDIPNQPLWGMKEDDLIAHTFTKAIETGDYSWPLLFPMTKSAVRAMDALQEYSQQKWDQPIKRFITTGASKRGWTTWFTGVVDPRVVAIMPMVYDNLNLAAQMPHQLELWGKYSPQIEDYTRRGLQQMLESPAGRQLGSQVDPFTYRDKLTMPKLLINGANDAYWTIDALNYYRDELQGETYQLYVPNAGHSLGDLSKVLAATTGFVRLIASDRPRPQLTWESGVADGRATVTIVAPTATKASLWWADGTGGLFTNSTWSEAAMTGGAAGWTAEVQVPQGHDLACFGEITTEVDGQGMPLSTPIRLIRAK